MDRTEYVIPWVQMRAKEEYIRRASRQYPVLEPFAPRHSISYFNNNKEESRKSAYERLHRVDGYDAAKPRCDRTKPSLYWLEISKENRGHKVPMTANLWYGRPNRVQVDFPGKKFNRTSKMQEFFDHCGFSLASDDEKPEIC
ncbi:PREDICTED: uncharacterized protein LOC108545535 [Eufriesea mexicana]|uniref:uncharacterized protein LOC108545535 n=1 Tax=Eufriesea mexicana TaxID=516756 RepID=UPI00083BBED9|nr:PREDICTED: uncharacterized protein LOC108545535 [Eufriesea mexicana]